ncbi:hypothetical protein [Halobellus rarus]|uniref:DUF1616 domain-containing protein n=1 Tax=Halobellus rarus TaxID=1126237 RepID=A0ABD6CPJ3_9EURY|nr:hypothetical protein [Halobellus rarus]
MTRIDHSPLLPISFVFATLILFVAYNKLSEGPTPLKEQALNILVKSGRIPKLYSTVSVGVFSLLAVLIVGQILQSTAIVLVTLFYASVLFFDNIFDKNTPMPRIEKPDRYYDSEHTNEKDTQGFKFEFQVRNIGGRKLQNPTVQYKLYDIYDDSNTPWKNLSTDNSTIEPGMTNSYSIDGWPVTEGSSVDYVVVIRVKPYLGFSLSRDRKSFTIP